MQMETRENHWRRSVQGALHLCGTLRGGGALTQSFRRGYGHTSPGLVHHHAVDSGALRR